MPKITQLLRSEVRIQSQAVCLQQLLSTSVLSGGRVSDCVCKTLIAPVLFLEGNGVFMLEKPFLRIYATQGGVRNGISIATQNSMTTLAILMPGNHHRKSTHPLPLL